MSGINWSAMLAAYSAVGYGAAIVIAVAWISVKGLECMSRPGVQLERARLIGRTMGRCFLALGVVLILLALAHARQTDAAGQRVAEPQSTDGEAATSMDQR